MDATLMLLKHFLGTGGTTKAGNQLSVNAPSQDTSTGRGETWREDLRPLERMFTIVYTKLGKNTYTVKVRSILTSWCATGAGNDSPVQRTNRCSLWKVFFRRGWTASQGVTKVSFHSPKAVVILDLDQVEKLQEYFSCCTHQLLEKLFRAIFPCKTWKRNLPLCKAITNKLTFPRETLLHEEKESHQSSFHISYHSWSGFPFAPFNLKFTCHYSFMNF